MSYDVFISHSTRDARYAEDACAELEKSGLGCWIAPRDIAPGTTWSGSITKGIDASRVLLLLLSRHANESNEVVREVERASRMKKHLLAVRIEDVGPVGDLEFFLFATQWLDAFPPPLRPRLAGVARAVKALLEIPDEPAPPVTPNEPEFVEVDLDDFGRSGASRIKLVDRLFEDR